MIHFFTLTIIINYYFYGLQLTIVRFKNIYTKTKLQSFVYFNLLNLVIYQKK